MENYPQIIEYTSIFRIKTVSFRYKLTVIHRRKKTSSNIKSNLIKIKDYIFYKNFLSWLSQILHIKILFNLLFNLLFNFKVGRKCKRKKWKNLITNFNMWIRYTQKKTFPFVSYCVKMFLPIKMRVKGLE